MTWTSPNLRHLQLSMLQTNIPLLFSLPSLRSTRSHVQASMNLCHRSMGQSPGIPTSKRTIKYKQNQRVQWEASPKGNSYWPAAIIKRPVIGPLRRNVPRVFLPAGAARKDSLPKTERCPWSLHIGSSGTWPKGQNHKNGLRRPAASNKL